MVKNLQNYRQDYKYGLFMQKLWFTERAQSVASLPIDGHFFMSHLWPNPSPIDTVTHLIKWNPQSLSRFLKLVEGTDLLTSKWNLASMTQKDPSRIYSALFSMHVRCFVAFLFPRFASLWLGTRGSMSYHDGVRNLLDARNRLARGDEIDYMWKRGWIWRFLLCMCLVLGWGPLPRLAPTTAWTWVSCGRRRQS